MLQKLPIGIQSFEKLRKDDFLYVDKTSDYYRLITNSRTAFLSRPRRFGKSLMISTMEAIFQGKQELFEELYIYDKWDWTQRYPVIRIDFSGMSHRTPELLTHSLHLILDLYFDHYNLPKVDAPLDTKFQILITKLHQSAGAQVVVLIDEYDKPITDNLHDLAIAGGNRMVLHDFYQVLKASDEHLRFIFLTGVSKFSKVSVFSGLNNLNDITIDLQYVTICGYTQTELESYFDPYIEEFATQERISKQKMIDEIKRWYDGYSWDGVTAVYNPFSTLQLLQKKQFLDYWFASGTPTFLVNLIQERNDVEMLLNPFEIPVDGFDAFDIQSLDTKLLLFQTGYLTVKKVEKDLFGSQLLYTLGVPNEEVKKALVQHILGSFTARQPADVYMMGSRMMRHLFGGDVVAFERSLQELYARIPYQLHIPREAYYHSLFLLWLNLLGFKVDAEVATDKGRIDAVWTWENRIVIAEIKYTEAGDTAPLLEEASQQMRERRYYERYTGENNRIALLAIAFAGKEIACRMVELG